MPTLEPVVRRLCCGLTFGLLVLALPPFGLVAAQGPEAYRSARAELAAGDTAAALERADTLELGLFVFGGPEHSELYRRTLNAPMTPAPKALTIPSPSPTAATR